MKRVKQEATKVVAAVKSIPNVWTNLVHLVEAGSLIAVSGVAWWITYNHEFSTNVQVYGLRFAAVVIALRGASEFIKYLNRK